jgi:hypothetical protein
MKTDVGGWDPARESVWKIVCNIFSLCFFFEHYNDACFLRNVITLFQVIFAAVKSQFSNFRTFPPPLKCGEVENLQPLIGRSDCNVCPSLFLR